MAYDKERRKLYVDETSDKGGIAMWQIYKCLGYNRRDKNGNMALGMAIVNAEINEFSRHKPFPHPDPNFDSKEERHEAEKVANYAITIPDYKFTLSNLKGMAEAMYAGELNWEYHRPKGLHATDPKGDERFRYEDFDGYYHLAKAPISAITTSESHSTPYETFGVVALFKVIRANDPEQLSLEDLRPSGVTSGVSFRDFYLGFCAWEVGTDTVYYKISDITYGEYLDTHIGADEIGDGMGIDVPTSYTEKTYMYFPFFVGDRSSDATIWAVPYAKTFITVKRDNTLNRQVQVRTLAYIFSDQTRPLNYRAEIYNGTREEIKNVNYEIYGLRSNDYTDRVVLLSSGTIPSIPAGATYYLPTENGGTYDDGINISQMEYVVCLLTNYDNTDGIYPTQINKSQDHFDPPFNPNV